MWLYGSWIYNSLCNQCLSPLKLWVQIPLMARCTKYNIIWSNLWVTFGRSMVFLRVTCGRSIPVSSTNKTDCHDITEILLKVALNTLTHIVEVFYQCNLLIHVLSFFCISKFNLNRLKHIISYSGTCAIRHLSFLTSCNIRQKFMVRKYFC